MNYGSSKPAKFELSDKYFPNNHSFTKSFCGGNFRFNGLNTAKSVSNIHDTLNEFWSSYFLPIQSFFNRLKLTLNKDFLSIAFDFD